MAALQGKSMEYLILTTSSETTEGAKLSLMLMLRSARPRFRSRTY